MPFPMVSVRFRRVLGASFIMALALAASAAAQNAAYLLGARDVLKITVWSEPTLTGTYVIGSTGAFAFPLIGTIDAAGRSADDVAAELRKRLADGFLLNPQLTVDITDYNSQRIFVVGEVRTPGAVALTGSLSLVEALTRVGSLTETAGGELVVVRPAKGRSTQGPTLSSDPGAAEMLRLDVKALQSRGPTTNLALQDGDTIIVPRAELIFVTGQVNSPGSYPYSRDMTVLQAISQAGGVNDLGSTKRLKLVRITGGKKVERKASLGDQLQPGDTVVVSTRWF